jgi:hypothetical protein
MAGPFDFPKEVVRSAAAEVAKWLDGGHQDEVPPAPEEPRRLYYALEYRAGNGQYEGEDVERRWVVDPADATLVSSELMPPDPFDGRASRHSPALDIDFAARLVPSSTPGHFHLYLDGLSMDWPTYARLLNALADAGVIERGYADASLRRGASFLRLPGATKRPEGEDMIRHEPPKASVKVTAPAKSYLHHKANAVGWY